MPETIGPSIGNMCDKATRQQKDFLVRNRHILTSAAASKYTAAELFAYFTPPEYFQLPFDEQFRNTTKNMQDIFHTYFYSVCYVDEDSHDVTEQK